MTILTYRTTERSWDNGTKRAVRFVVTVPHEPKPFTKQFAYGYPGAKFASKRLATQAGKAWVGELNVLADDDVFLIPSDKLTVGQACDLYLAEIAKSKYHRALGTIDGHTTNLVRVREFFDGTQLASVKRKDLTRLFDWMTKNGCSEDRVRRIRRSLNQVYDVAIQYGKVNLNVSRKWKTLIVSKRSEIEDEEKKRVQLSAIPTEAQVRDILNAAVGWFKVALIVAFSTGMRWGEIRGLKRENIFFPEAVPDGMEALYPHGFIRVWHAADSHNIVDLVKTPKSRRIVPLSAPVAKVLQEHMRGSNAALVFHTSNGTPIDPTTMRKNWHPTLVKAGLENGTMKMATTHRKNGKRVTVSIDVPKGSFTPHASRHFAVSYFIAQGIIGKPLSDLIGHTTWEYTQRKYYHLLPQALRDTSEQINAAVANLLAAPGEKPPVPKLLEVAE